MGGKLAVRGTRLSVSFVLARLAEGMSAEEIAQTYGQFSQEAIPEIMKVGSELLHSGMWLLDANLPSTLTSHIRSIDTIARPICYAGAVAPPGITQLVRAKLDAFITI